ncbi:hypothetical protein [Undibacterium sp.]|jgi:hypothetical protein|uniref:hypothetical protein n=1 Tax=Undibacterium sp. TaxID=1914977 RepID=UPI002CEB48C9|nr:hypothetical protein [Undibacterium sp.]HTD04247.1 hypothetical protein [Undibacterium sp.]
MKTPAILTMFLSLALCRTELIYASNQFECTPLVELASIEKLPAAVSNLLGANQRGLEGIANRGNKFNATDIVDSELPMRRLGFGAISSNCVLVAIEHGGYGYNVELWSFEYRGLEWHAEKRGITFRIPKSVQELVSKELAPDFPIR